MRRPSPNKPHRTTLDIQPLSAFQQQPIDTVLSVEFRGSLDRQIANHVNETGYIMLRKRKWIPEIYFPIKYFISFFAKL
jgi:hypothetical protein